VTRIDPKQCFWNNEFVLQFDCKVLKQSVTVSSTLKMPNDESEFAKKKLYRFIECPENFIEQETVEKVGLNWMWNE